MTLMEKMVTEQHKTTIAATLLVLSLNYQCRHVTIVFLRSEIGVVFTPPGCSGL
jgi:hypothetical protein